MLHFFWIRVRSYSTQNCKKEKKRKEKSCIETMPKNGQGIVLSLIVKVTKLVKSRERMRREEKEEDNHERIVKYVFQPNLYFIHIPIRT